MPKTQKQLRLKTKLVKSKTGSGWHFLIFDGKISDKLGFTDRFRRILCSINGGKKFNCALMPDGDTLYIIVNKKHRDTLGIVAGDMVNVVLEKDESKYGLPMPEEFQAVLDQDADGDQLFHALGKGQQRSILYLLSRPKDIDLRIHHSLIVVQHLKENDGKVVGDKLYHELKRPKFDR
jgi:Domain of unknown function (DUF1905)